MEPPEIDPRQFFEPGALDESEPLVLGEQPGGGSQVDPIERRLFGPLADPEVRRALETRAAEVRRAIANGATDVCLYEPGRVPVVDGVVIYRSFPAQVLRVRDPGSPHARLDLLQYHTGRPESFAEVQHDLAAGWSWLAEPPPPDPTPDDRIRAAIAAGKPIPKVGDVVKLVRAKPRSYLGTELVALRARVVALVDVRIERARAGEVGVTLDLEVVDEPVEGLDPALFSGTVPNVNGPVDLAEGWSRVSWLSKMLEPDSRHLSRRPCDRCGQAIVSNHYVNFHAQDHKVRSSPDRVFASTCRPCAEAVGRMFFVPPESAELAARELED